MDTVVITCIFHEFHSFVLLVVVVSFLHRWSIATLTFYTEFCSEATFAKILTTLSKTHMHPFLKNLFR